MAFNVTFFPRATSEGFLLCTSSAGAELRVPAAAVELPSYRNLSLHMGCLLDKNRQRQPWLQTRHLLCPQPRKLQHMTSQYHQQHRGGAEGAPSQFCKVFLRFSCESRLELKMRTIRNENNQK